MGSPDAGAPDAQSSSLDAGAIGAALGSYEMTYYWLAFEQDHPGAAVETLYDEQCEELAQVSAGFADALRLEGSGKLLDGRVLNYEGACPCANTPCFYEVDASAPWGQGVENISLRPFRSIAVDPQRIAIGTGIYIHELDGLLMPGDAEIGMYRHDGCVVADDVGSAILNQHIDFFAGLREYYLEIGAAIGSDFVTLSEGGQRCASR